MKNTHYRDPVTGEICAERRTGTGRRSSASIASLFARTPRRRKSRGRRKTDRGAYVDVYDRKTWSIAVAVLILSLIDALLTWMHLVRGSAYELNPILGEIINHGGIPAFFAAKAAMTIFPMVVIVVHKEWTLGRYAARLCLLAYILISCYHVYLLFGARYMTALLIRSGL
jgi:hypothetical protein